MRNSRRSPYAHLFPVCEGIAAWLHPHAEVVLHDLKSDRIVAIWNAFSRRTPGTASLIGEELQLAEDVEVYGPYEKGNHDGRRLKCVSSVVRDARGRRIALLCLNLDVSSFDALRGFLDAFTATAMDIPPALVKQDWREQIHSALRAFLRDKRIAPAALTQAHRIEFVRWLDSRHLFATRNAAQHVGAILGVSRATVYNWLGRARKEKR